MLATVVIPRCVQRATFVARPSQFVKPILLYALPLLGFSACASHSRFESPSSPGRIDEALALSKPQPTFGAGVMAAFYHMGIAGALASAVCAISLWWCLKWIYARGFQELTLRRAPIFWGRADFAIAAPILFLACHRPFECKRFAIDDCVTTAFFRYHSTGPSNIVCFCLGRRRSRVAGLHHLLRQYADGCGRSWNSALSGRSSERTIGVPDDRAANGRHSIRFCF